MSFWAFVFVIVAILIMIYDAPGLRLNPKTKFTADGVAAFGVGFIVSIAIAFIPRALPEWEQWLASAGIGVLFGLAGRWLLSLRRRRT